MKTPILIAGLPRSGSTLLMHVLAQNPDIHLNHGTCPLPGLITSIKNGWHSLNETKAMPADKSYGLLASVLRSVLFGPYEDIPENYFISKNRGWLNLIETLHIITEPRILVCVRSVPEILASLEWQYKNARALGITHQELANPESFMTLADRCKVWLSGTQFLGSAYLMIQDALAKGCAENLYFVDFDQLTNAPKATLEGVYQFLNLAPYEHDFSNIQVTIQEDDRPHGFYNLHETRPEIKPLPKRANLVLGETLAKQYLELNKLWQ